ncbi:hypothetical protein KR044_011297 [Drosophila immigrans]|nr:hypothetical protein KR044_011297 [Drosophila immigrans]
MPHEELYQKANERVMNKHGFRMYNGLRELLTDHFNQKLRPELLEHLGSNFLSKLDEVWIEHQTSIRIMGDMIGFLDSTYAATRGLESVYMLGLQTFRSEIISFVDIKEALLEQLFGRINAERLGETINQLEIKNACTMLLTLGKGSRYFYVQIFETAFLAQTAEFYEQESAKLWENKAVDYEQEMKLHMVKESARLSQYLDKESVERVTKLLEEIMEKQKTKDAR